VSPVDLVERPPEEVALFNAGFLAVLSYHAAHGYKERAGDQGMPAVLMYLMAPLVLHRQTRQELPHTVVAQMGLWIHNHPVIVASLPERAVALRPLVSEALTLGIRHGVVVPVGATVVAAKLRRRPPGLRQSEEVRACKHSAEFIGRWFAAQGDPLTTLALWGLRP
jgi:hypothetical protein